MKKNRIIGKFIGNIIWYMHLFKYKTIIILDNPAHETLNDRIVYVVGNEEYFKWAYLKCPCGCGDVIMLSLTGYQFPSWRLKNDFIGRPSISPSINRLEGCRSHLWIKKGKVQWSYE